MFPVQKDIRRKYEGWAESTQPPYKNRVKGFEIFMIFVIFGDIEFSLKNIFLRENSG